MKITNFRLLVSCCALALCLFLNTSSLGQGRVVINEFMSWSGCTVNSEFIELLNFGPGPMDIGCYIVTNGKYAVTIPANTIVQPGEYFLIAGQDVLAQDCGNSDSAVTVDLNWNACNCADQVIPSTGHGFLQDGGNSNEKVILLDPDLNVLDAVSRSATPSSSDLLTTSGVGGSCSPKTFDLDNMTISYEGINNSTGKDNSFSRKVDGDCGWVKTTDISAGAPNKTGSSSSATYSFTTLSASECNGLTGSISIGVGAADLSSLFPMTYTLAFDKDSNNIFNDNDEYIYGVDVSPPSIDISDLAYGRYRITVGSSSGCNLQSFDFFIFNCYGVLLPLNLVAFKYDGVRDGQHSFRFVLEGAEYLDKLTMEVGEGDDFRPVSTAFYPIGSKPHDYVIKVPLSSGSRFRLKIIDINNAVSYSSVLNIPSALQLQKYKLWPNPVRGDIFFQITSPSFEKTEYVIINSTGVVMRKGTLNLRAGINTQSVSMGSLPGGIYQILINGTSAIEPISYRFVKQ